MHFCPEIRLWVLFISEPKCGSTDGQPLTMAVRFSNVNFPKLPSNNLKWVQVFNFKTRLKKCYSDAIVMRISRCWWQNHHVGDNFRVFGHHQHLKVVTMIIPESHISCKNGFAENDFYAKCIKSASEKSLKKILLFNSDPALFLV